MDLRNNKVCAIFNQFTRKLQQKNKIWKFSAGNNFVKNHLIKIWSSNWKIFHNVPTHNKHTQNKHISRNKHTLFALTKMCLSIRKVFLQFYNENIFVYIKSTRNTRNISSVRKIFFENYKQKVQFWYESLYGIDYIISQNKHISQNLFLSSRKCAYYVGTVFDEMERFLYLFIL